MKDQHCKPDNESEFYNLMNGDHLRRAQKLSHMGSWMIDLGAGIVLASEEACRIYGSDKRESSLAEVQALVVPEFRASMDEALRRLVNDKAPYDMEYKIKRKSDGEIRYIHSVAEYDPERRIVTGTIHDITWRKRAEDALHESEARFRSLFDNAMSGIVYIDAHGNILEVNARMLNFLGSPSPEETKKLNMLTFPLLVKVGFSADLERCIRTREVVSGAAEYQSKWGKTRYLEYILNPIGRGETISGIIAKVEDITERKAVEEEIRSLLAEKDLLMREIHHRLKNNMAVIESLLKMQIGGSDCPQADAALQDAVGRLSSMRVLYDKLYRSKDLKEVSAEGYILTLLDEIFGVFPESGDIEIISDIDDFPIPSEKVFTLGIIINELLTNILKYAFTEKQKVKRVTLSAARKDNMVSIVIRDNGVGCDVELLTDGSKGFGLQLIRMLTEQMNGTVVFENDQGTVCSLEFPCETA
ncbi:MAG: PAS domain S-box protein [Spirochaetales bacterium]|nr:PAS domain S-box protein [Spirochaetales bacterium]